MKIPLSFIALVLVASACTKSPESRVIGTWKLEPSFPIPPKDQAFWKFTKDTCVASSPSNKTESQTLKYRISAETPDSVTISIEKAANPSEGNLTIHFISKDEGWADIPSGKVTLHRISN